MPPSSTPGKGFLAKALGAASAQPLHPVVSAVQFAHLSRTTGGASMRAQSGEVLHNGQSDGYAVGGARNDTTHRRVPSRTEPLLGGTSDMRLDSVLQHRRRIAKTSSDPSRLMGSWDARQSDEPRPVMDVDASDHMAEGDRPKAEKAGSRRGEDGIWGFKKPEYISTMKNRAKGAKL